MFSSFSVIHFLCIFELFNKLDLDKKKQNKNSITSLTHMQDTSSKHIQKCVFSSMGFESHSTSKETNILQ